MPPTVLITGFGPFPGAPFNPSGPLALALARRRRPALADVGRIAHVFPTSYAAVDRELPALMARHAPDVILMFGLATRTKFLRIEARARNVAALIIPDVDGHAPAHHAIIAGASSWLHGRAPFTRLVTAARGAWPTRLSRDAGRYLCNYAYWHARSSHPQGGGPLVQFVHIPPVTRGPRPQRRVKHHAPALTDLIKAGEAILVALIAASRR